MIRPILSVLLLVTFSFASEKESATKIVKAIVSTIDTDKKTLSVWIDNADQGVYKSLDTGILNIAKSCEDSEVLIVKKKLHLEEKCLQKPILVLDYDLLSVYDSSVSAFFWKKGRPNIVFIKSRLEKFDIKLPPSYEIYLEEEIW